MAQVVETDDAAVSKTTSATRTMTFFVLMAVYTLSSLDRFIISVLLEPIKQTFGLSDAWLGVLAGAFAAFYVIAGIPLGWAVDRFNRRTLLSICLALWSAMTVLSGLAVNAWMLLLARLGVGIGEGANSPACYSMVSDLYPPQQRALRITLLYLANPIGAMLAMAGGAWLAAEYGWRMVFLVAGVPGLLLALVLATAVPEPRRGGADGLQEVKATPPLRETLAFVWSQRSLRNLLIALGLTGFATNGEITWLTSFMIREHGLSLKEAGFVLSICLGPLAGVGMLIFGYLSDRLGAQDERWRGGLIVLSALLLSAFLFMALLAPTWPLAAVALFIWFFSGAGIWAPAYALCQSLVAVRMRGVVSALAMVSVAAGAISPHMIGMISDALKAEMGVHSLRIGMLAAGLAAPWAVVHFALMIRHIRDDIRRAGAEG